MARKILVTGASSEIGAAVCSVLAGPGDETVLHCNSRESRCRSLASSLPGATRILRADIREKKELAGLCEEARGCDVLVNCAAVTKTGLLVQMDEGDVGEMVAANVLALAALCKSAISGMILRRSGNIVNVSSVAATRGNPGQAVYAGTKGFMEAMTRSLAAEYGPRGIRVNCVAPGPVDAGSLKELLADAGDEVRGNIALRRLGTPGDVASAVRFLCSDEALFINGAVIPVNGGFGRGV